jgi:glycosyltransferase involved in cell wall biosynthesis
MESSPRSGVVSIVVPMYNEAEDVAALVDAIERAMQGSRHAFELIVVDDGSEDGSAERLAELAASRPWLRPRFLRRNYGQSTALQAGFDSAAGDIVVTLDADLQNDPAEIPRLVALLDERPDIDVVSGWRRHRQDSTMRRTLPSRIANALISRVTGVALRDYGCALKAYRAPVIRDLRLYGEQHRFIPALAAEVGARIIEVEVAHRARAHGRSKYGLDRSFRVLLDLLWVAFLLRFLHRPIHAFGGVGLALGLAGAAVLAWLAFDKLVLGHPIGARPLLLLGLLLTVVGVQLLAAGMLGELLMRVYHEPQGRRQYLLREVRPRASEAGAETRPVAVPESGATQQARRAAAAGHERGAP